MCIVDMRKKKQIVVVILLALTVLAMVIFSYISVDATYQLDALRYAVNRFSTPEVVALDSLQNDTRAAQLRRSVEDACDVSSLKSWYRRVITELRPPIKRDCKLLREGNDVEISEVKQAVLRWKRASSLHDWSVSMSNCSTIVEEFSDNFYVSPEELSFPLAFSIVMYDSVEQTVRLLRAIYRPHNLYCIHLDASHVKWLVDVFTRLSICLDNVFIASNLQDVRYDHSSTMTDAQLSCNRDLIKFSSHKWRYVINICGKELPCMTNREMVQSLKKLNGASAIRTGSINDNMKEHRLIWKQEFDEIKDEWHLSNTTLGPPPHNITVYKGSTYIAASRPFTEFLLTSNVSRDLYNYFKDASISEEHYYASLFHHPGTPGGYQANVHQPFIVKVHWLYNLANPKSLCTGKIIHGICILTVGELPLIQTATISNNVFFFNKYFMEKDHVVMDCMEERLLQQNLLEYRQDCAAEDVDYYYS